MSSKEMEASDVPGTMALCDQSKVVMICENFTTSAVVRTDTDGISNLFQHSSSYVLQG